MVHQCPTIFTMLLLCCGFLGRQRCAFICLGGLGGFLLSAAFLLQFVFSSMLCCISFCLKNALQFNLIHIYSFTLPSSTLTVSSGSTNKISLVTAFCLVLLSWILSSQQQKKTLEGDFTLEGCYHGCLLLISDSKVYIFKVIIK